MRQIIGWFLPLKLSVFCFLAAWPLTVHAEQWREEKSTHFIVYFIGDSAFAKTVIDHGEHHYSQINLDLGLTHVVKRNRVPWLWDKRCRIYLYPDREAYVRATGAPIWSGGVVRYRERHISSFIGANSFLYSILPHELTHILFREFVGFDNARVPRWLDEGVAQYSEVGRKEEALWVMQKWLERGIYLPLKQLNQLNVNRAHTSTARVFYAQAVTLVHFFLSRYGSRRFIDFCSNLRDGYPIDRALSFATSSSINSLSKLEEEWLRFFRQVP